MTPLNEFKLPNEFKFLTKNRHVDRDFDVAIKLKEADASKVMEDLKGPGTQALLLVGSMSNKDASQEE